MKPIVLLVACLVLALPAAAQAQQKLSPADETAAFSAAGFKREGSQWRGCDDPGTPSYTPGALEQVADLNGDGLPEAVITEGSAHCFGNTGQGYAVVSKQPGGAWRLISQGAGILTFLASKGAGGWPDVEVGGPGFCFPVERWTGQEYRLLRHQYEGRPCNP